MLKSPDILSCLEKAMAVLSSAYIADSRVIKSKKGKGWCGVKDGCFLISA